MNHSRKGADFERVVAKAFRDAGISCHRMMLSKPSDLVAHIDRKRIGECKKRARGFKTLYGLFEKADFAVVAADRQEPLVIVPLKDFLEMVGKG